MSVDRASILQHVLDDHPWNELANPGLCDLANAALESLNEDVGQYEMLREMTDSCPDCGGTGIEEVPERSGCCMCDGQGIVMLDTVADALRETRVENERLIAFRDEVARHVGLYESGWNDEMGLTEREVIPFIADALDALADNQPKETHG